MSVFLPLPRPGLLAALIVAALSCAVTSGSSHASSPSSSPAADSGGGKTWYMAPDARCGSGKGTLESPWCIQDALDSGKVKPGDTIYGRLGGTYKLGGDGGSFSTIRSTLQGSEGRRITVRPYAPDQTTPTTLIRVACDQKGEEKAENCFTIESNWVDYHEFEVANFGDPRRQRITGQFDRADFGSGVRIVANTRRTTGVGNRLINWVVHDTSGGVFKSELANPTDFYGMVIYNYGFLYDTAKVKRIGGHAFYLRNGLAGKEFAKGCGGSAEDSNPARMSLIDNIVSGSLRVEGFGAASLAYQDYGTCACVMHRNELYDGNFFLGGTLSGGCPRENNFTLGTRDQTLTNNWWSSYTVGYNGAGCDNVTIDGNFMFRPMHAPRNERNEKSSPTYFMEQTKDKVNPCRSNVKFTNNTYWGNWERRGGSKKAGADATNGFDADWFPGGGNVYLPDETTPDRNFTAVRPNKFRHGSCNVYVANFLDAASVPVDLSQCGLADGASYEVRSIYDYMGKPVGSGTFSAAAPRVDFPMTPAANPIANSVGHLEGGAPGSYPDMTHSLTKPGGNIFRNAFVVLTTGASKPAPAAAAQP